VSAAAQPRAEGEIISRTKSLVVSRCMDGEDPVYAFAGRCTATDPAFQNELDRIGDRIAADAGSPMLDLHSLEMANSAFVSLVAKLVAQLDRRGLRLVILNPDKRTRDLFAIVGFLDTLDIREE